MQRFTTKLTIDRIQKHLLPLGCFASLAWGVVILGLVVGCSDSGLGLNGWGDFLSGFVAPIAFLWLVIGYLQQGYELKQNSNAIRVQTEALQQDVESSRQVVQAMERERMAAQPYISSDGYQGRTDVDHAMYVRNSGGDARQVHVEVDKGMTAIFPADLPSGVREIVSFRWSGGKCPATPEDPATVTIHYLDIYRVPRSLQALYKGNHTLQQLPM